MLSTPKKRILISAALTLAVILLAAAAGFIMKNTSLRLFCAFNALTHLRCPGCGNTRGFGSFVARLFGNIPIQSHVCAGDVLCGVGVGFLHKKLCQKRQIRLPFPCRLI